MTATPHWSKPPRPRRELDLKRRLEDFAKGIARDPAKYNLSKEEFAEISRVIGAYVKAFDLGKQPISRTRGTVREKNNARRAAEAIHSQYYNYIKNDPYVSDIDKMNIGVKPINLKRRKIRVPRRTPRIRAIKAEPRRHTIKFMDVETLDLGKAPSGGREGAKGKPPGAAFIQVYAGIGAIGSEERELLKEAREMGLFTKNPIEIEHKPEHNGKLAVYIARWISPTGEAGAWSKPTSMTIVG